MKCFLDGMWRGEEGKRAGAVPRPNHFREPSRLQPRYTPVLIRKVPVQPGRAGMVWKGGSAGVGLAMLHLIPVSRVQQDAKGKTCRRSRNVLMGRGFNKYSNVRLNPVCAIMYFFFFFTPVSLFEVFSKSYAAEEDIYHGAPRKSRGNFIPSLKINWDNFIESCNFKPLRK